jgi:2'-hydroxyisoflavone reductase
VLAGERKLAGIYNMVGPAERLTARAYIDAAGRIVGSRAEVVWKGDFPREMFGLPLVPPYSAVPGFATMNNAKARAAGLRFRPLEETLRSNWLDHRARRGDAFDFAAAGIGLSAEKEAELLAG